MNRMFYIKWLKTVSFMTILFGISALLASHPNGSFSWILLFDLLTYPIDGNPSSFSKDSYQINAVLGGVMIGWGTLMYLLSSELVSNKNDSIAKSMLISVCLWFIFDSSGSFVSGLYGNIVLNSVFFSLIFVPLYSILYKKTTLN